MFLAIRNLVADLKPNLDSLKSDLGSQLDKLGAQSVAQRQTLEAEISALKESFDSQIQILLWLFLAAIGMVSVAGTLLGVLLVTGAPLCTHSSDAAAHSGGMG